ncbi:uncharacterized protein LOC127003049 [Eriocheir sinensis]|uniref:uncharacterized protein LOC127003049 n=1 Tax=Eriocheir sinensis TaxID=95602 RepID=UPI0021C7D613|nr:uncharacterized protein LOC127003049 [Eriocheir sinensis]
MYAVTLVTLLFVGVTVALGHPHHHHLLHHHNHHQAGSYSGGRSYISGGSDLGSGSDSTPGDLPATDKEEGRGRGGGETGEGIVEGRREDETEEENKEKGKGGRKEDGKMNLWSLFRERNQRKTGNTAPTDYTSDIRGQTVTGTSIRHPALTDSSEPRGKPVTDHTSIRHPALTYSSDIRGQTVTGTSIRHPALTDSSEPRGKLVTDHTSIRHPALTYSSDIRGKTVTGTSIRYSALTDSSEPRGKPVSDHTSEIRHPAFTHTRTHSFPVSNDDEDDEAVRNASAERLHSPVTSKIGHAAKGDRFDVSENPITTLRGDASKRRTQDELHVGHNIKMSSGVSQDSSLGVSESLVRPGSESFVGVSEDLKSKSQLQHHVGHNIKMSSGVSQEDSSLGVSESLVRPGSESFVGVSEDLKSRSQQVNQVDHIKVSVPQKDSSHEVSESLSQDFEGVSEYAKPRSQHSELQPIPMTRLNTASEGFEPRTGESLPSDAYPIQTARFVANPNFVHLIEEVDEEELERLRENTTTSKSDSVAERVTAATPSEAVTVHYEATKVPFLRYMWNEFVNIGDLLGREVLDTVSSRLSFLWRSVVKFVKSRGKRSLPDAR